MVALKKPLEVGDVKPPKQLLELEHLYTRDNSMYCVRPSCDGCPHDPNCQREEMFIKIGPGINIREAFRSRPGYKWVCIDFAGIELRVAALLSGEPVWVRAFQEDRDLHCVAAGTRVVTPDGYQKIENLVGREGVTLSEFGPKRFLGAGASGKKEVFSVVTRTGAIVKASKDHRFRVQEDDGSLSWRRLEALRPGDTLLCQRGSGGLVPEDRGYDPEFWFVVGWLWGDGGYALADSEYAYHRWYFTEFEDTSRQRVKDYLIRSGVRFSEQLRDLQHENSTVRVWDIRANDPLMGKMLPAYEREGKWREGGFPEALWTQGLRQWRAFVDGAFSSDGSVHDIYRYGGNRSGSRASISFHTKWSKVAQDMRKLLLCMGMVSTVREFEGTYKDFGGGYGGDYFGGYQVTLLGSRSWDYFVDQVGFTHMKKDNLLGKRVVVKNGGDKFLGIRRASKIISQVTMAKIRPRWGVVNKDRGVAMEVVRRIRRGRTDFIPDTRIPYMVDLYGASVFQDYEEHGWWFDVIEKIESDGDQETYDLYDSESSSFTADGFVTHNSEMAKIMFRTDDPDKAQRDIAKMGNFGNLYLSSIETFWHLTTLTYNEAAVAWKKWWAAVPTYEKWTKNQEEYYKAHGHVWTFFRRKREMRAMIEKANANEGKGKGKKSGKKVGHGFCKRTSVNSPVQGTSADLLKMAMTRVDDFLTKEKLRDDVKMMLTVHDELDFEIRETPAMFEILREIGRQMTLTPKGKVLPTIPNWNIPLKVDIELGDNWGNLVGIDDLDPATKDLPKPEKAPPKRDQVVLRVSGITSEDAGRLHMAIFQAANVQNVVKVPLMIMMGDRAYASKALDKVSEGHLRRLIQGIPGVEII